MVEKRAENGDFARRESGQKAIVLFARAQWSPQSMNIHEGSSTLDGSGSSWHSHGQAGKQI